MDWEDIESRFHKTRREILAFIATEVASVVIFGRAWTFALTSWGVVCLALNEILNSKTVKRVLPRAWQRHWVPWSYAVVLVFALLTSPLLPKIVNEAYQTGTFGEPPHNRFFREYPISGGVTIEWGVESVPMSAGFDAIIWLNNKDFSLSNCWYATPGGSDTNHKDIMVYHSGTKMGDPGSFMLEPGEGTITPDQSLFAAFESKTSSLRAIHCMLKAGTESVRDAKECTRK